MLSRVWPSAALFSSSASSESIGISTPTCRPRALGRCANPLGRQNRPRDGQRGSLHPQRKVLHGQHGAHLDVPGSVVQVRPDLCSPFRAQRVGRQGDARLLYLAGGDHHQARRVLAAVGDDAPLAKVARLAPQNKLARVEGTQKLASLTPRRRAFCEGESSVKGAETEPRILEREKPCAAESRALKSWVTAGK